MKIIMHYVDTPQKAVNCFMAITAAIEGGIKEGRNHFQTYKYPGMYVSVCRNHGSFTAYVQEVEE